MRMIFDRGTLVFEGAQRGSAAGKLTGVLWDERVGAYRAPAFRYRDLREQAAAIGVEDRVRPRVLRPGPWQTVNLRPYQDAALAAWQLNGRRGVVVLPTGAGKTHVALAAMLLIAA